MNFDRACVSCDWATDFSLEPSALTEKPCPSCGSDTVRFMSSAPHMVRDTFGSPMVDTTMAKETLVFQSRSEHKAAMKERGLALMDCHVPLPGTDKSPVTQKWESGRTSHHESDADRSHRLLTDARFQAARRIAIETHRERQDDIHDSSRHTRR